MLTIVHRLLDFIFPPRDTERLIRELSIETLVPQYHVRTHGAVQYLLSYQTDIIRALIQENKFHENKHAAKILAGMLVRYFNERPNQSLVLIPIPLSQTRHKERGYNQVEHILRELPVVQNIKINRSLLFRIKDTVPQTTLSREARLRNMTRVFKAAVPMESYENCRVIIIDDVVTTGATLAAARAALAPHLPPSTTLICLALAH